MSNVVYKPIDVVLEMPSTRILRLLLRHDWLSSEDIHDVLGTSYEFDPVVYDSTAQSLYRLVRRRRVERQRGRRGNRGCLYRITDLGRDELVRRLQTDMAVEDDGYRESA